jgi:hypothetical protein
VKRHKSQGNNHIPEEMNHARDIKHHVFNFMWNKEELPQQWKQFILAPNL